MKKKSLFAILAAASLAVAFTACSKDKPEEGTKEEPKSTEAKLIKFDVTGEDVSGKTITIEGAMFEKDKIVELSYLPDGLAALKAATKVEYQISDKATIAPDPATVTDFSVENGVKFTVTAEDGVTKVEYTVVAKAAEFSVKTETVWDKTYGDLGIAAHPFNTCGIAFSGRNFVMSDCQVFDLDGKKVGKLNLEGVPTANEANFQLADMSNDNKGVLVASIGVTATDGVPAKMDDVKKTYFFAWLNGWDKAPEKIRENMEANFAPYISVAGDLTKKAILTYPSPARGADQMHHVITFTDKNWAKPSWAGPMTGLPSNDGCWGQQISFTDGDPEGTFFIWDSRGNNQGAGFYARKGLKGENVALNGTLWTDKLVEKESHGGLNQYGNYSFGHARGFKYDGKDYVVASSSGWASAYVCIQPADPNEDYLLRSQVFAVSTPKSCSAYYYDSETGHGIVLFAAQDYQVVRYDIVREIL